MAYTKQTWSDYPATSTPINASRLNHIEEGIYDSSMCGPAFDALANEWTTSATYEVGDYVYYNSDVYRCLVSNTATLPTTESTWEKVKIGGELSQLNENIVEQGTSITNQGTYSTNEVVIGSFNGQPLYRKVFKVENLSIPMNTETTVCSGVPYGKKLVNYRFTINGDTINANGNGNVQAYISYGTFKVTQGLTGGFSSATVVLIVEYIK